MDKCLVAIDIFDGHNFERYEIVEERTGLVTCYCAIDGIKVPDTLWKEQRDAALARDMEKLELNYRQHMYERPPSDV